MIRFHVWEHTKDRRSPELRARYQSISQQVHDLGVERVYRERVRRNIAARAIAAASKLVDNVVPFNRASAAR